ncbi:MAG: hypothetical protein IPI81_02105 [Flavobacteriales bacterium]|nr:hypothetical protein [Flavobacteriales bacterium]MCC6939916.1 hypothetical protein [Flavobacteriales bacterium]
MRVRLIPCSAFLLLVSASLAQEPVSVEHHAVYRVIFNFDFRRTYVNADPVHFYGFRIGAQRDRDIIAVGFYGIGDAYIQPAVDLPGIGTRELRTNFDYAALTYERLLIDSKRWQVGVPVSIGLGNYRKSYVGDDRRIVPYSTNELVPLEATLHADYDLFWWIFVGAGGGYRYVLAADPEATRALSDRTYYLKVGLRVGEVVKRARKKLKD